MSKKLVFVVFLFLFQSKARTQFGWCKERASGSQTEKLYMLRFNPPVPSGVPHGTPERLPRFVGNVPADLESAALVAIKDIRGFPTQKRDVLVGGKSIYLGILRPGVAAIMREPKAVAATETLNRLAATLVDEPFTWTSIVCNINTVSSSHCDRNAKNSTSIICGLGNYTGGSFIQNETAYDIRGKMLLFDGAQEHSSSGFEGERMSIIFFTHRNWGPKFMEKHGAYLENLGFVLPRVRAFSGNNKCLLLLFFLFLFYFNGFAIFLFSARSR